MNQGLASWQAVNGKTFSCYSSGPRDTFPLCALCVEIIFRRCGIMHRNHAPCEAQRVGRPSICPLDVLALLMTSKSGIECSAALCRLRWAAAPAKILPVIRLTAPRQAK